MESVVVISFNEDGDPPDIEEMTKDAFKEKLKDQWWGPNPNFAEPGQKVSTGEFDGLVVIEGKIIKPRAVKVGTEYEL